MTDAKVDLVKALANVLPLKEAYQDSLQPATREVGAAGGEIGAVVRASLRPVRTLRIAWDTVFDRIDEWVTEKLSGAQPDQVVPPPPNLVGGVVTGLVFVQDEPVLRELFVRLLAASMLKSEQSHAHPAFAEFIKQMTPLEARIVRFIAEEPAMLKLDVRAHDMPEPKAPPPVPSSTRPASPFEAVTPMPSQMDDVQMEKYMDSLSTEAWTDEATFTELDLEHDFANESLLMPALENLERLQLVRISNELSNPSQISRYIEIARCPRSQAYIRKQEAGGKRPGLHKGLVIPTSLGMEFFRVCIGGSVGEAGESR